MYLSDSIDNTIITNNFINNTRTNKGGQIDGHGSTPNIWDDGTTGNYWNDFVNGSAYTIMLSTGLPTLNTTLDYDNHPQSQPFTIPTYPTPHLQFVLTTSATPQIETLALMIQLSQIQSSEAIIISGDGSIKPSTAPLKHVGESYTLTENIYSIPIVVERNNVIIDGAGYTLQGFGSGIAVNLTSSNVTVKNIFIANWDTGILGAYNNNTISNNYITENDKGIAIYADNYSITGNHITDNNFAIRVQGNLNAIFRNQILKNTEGFYITSSSGNTITENNIENNPTAISTDYGGFMVFRE